MIKYFGIEVPTSASWIYEKSPFVSHIGLTKYEAWSNFFTHPVKPHRVPLDEAIKAYEAIGYRCIELDMKEKL